MFKEEQQGLETCILTLLPQSLGPPVMREAGRCVRPSVQDASQLLASGVAMHLDSGFTS